MKPKIQDDMLLLAAGIVVSFSAWLFWHLLGDAGFNVLLAIAVFSLWADNIRLRRKLR